MVLFVQGECEFTENIFQLCKFALVGCLNTFIDWAVYFAIVKLYPVESIYFYTAAKGLSYFCGILNSYFLNRCWTFKTIHDHHEGGRFIRFVLVNAVGLGINSASIYIFLNLNLAQMTALFLATAIAFTFNFTLSKLWVFRKGKMVAKVSRG
ncbi:GtrA-like protein [Pelotomaculum schinkii]|uniref:GtrA-like protein n=1 Tax=Pelotomaculum schinkii TaxID=78350 RepID=A0A4Y7RE99_9FIRM|nr:MULTISPECIES: GtrA family protein [Pelotomaculum]TEB07103.1 GtrA-like protein [Pelotomaculum schinkii]TEB11631.1 GtrA-like protein [Pelotomaculum sp. FP]